MRVSLLLSVSMLAVSTPSVAQSPTAAPPAEQPARNPFDRADAEKAVSDLAAALEQNFVFPDAGRAYAAMLRANLAAGRYASFADAESFAGTVTEDLQAVHKDGHLRLRFVPPERRVRRQSGGGGGGPSESAVTKAGWLADTVAYIDFRGFPGDPATAADVRRFLDTHKNAETLIIDARQNGGGGLDEMNLIFGQIFAVPTILVTMDVRQAIEERQGSPFGEDPSLREVAGPASIVRREHFVTPAADQGALRDAKVYLLTSKDTFSAAEHLSLSLKRTGRATLIGEATGGGAHFGGFESVGTAYGAFIPVGRTFDPDTGESWEGVGVKPDIEVPAEKALDEALKLAGVSVSGDVALASLE